MSDAAVERDTGFTVSLRLPAYRLLWASSMLSGSGQWTLVVGRGWLMLKLTGSATAVGIVTFAAWLPFILATPVGGVLADRFERRKLAAIMQVCSLVSAGGLAVLVLSGHVQPWEVVFCALLAGFGRAVELPATTSLIPNMVPPQYLLNAISLNSVATFGSRLVGPLLVLLLPDHGNGGQVFVLTALLYALAAAMMLRVPPAPGRVRSTAGFVTQNREAWVYVAATAMLPTLFLIVTLHCGLVMTIDAVLPNLVKTALSGNSGTLSLLYAGMGAGAMAGTFALGGLRSDQAKGQLLLVTGILSGVTMALMAVMQAPLAAFLLISALGAVQGMFMALGNTLLQEVVPDRLRGRVSSAYSMSTGGAMGFSGLGGGAMADAVGVRAVFVFPSLAFVVCLLLLSGARPSLRRLYRTGTLTDATRVAAVGPAGSA